MKKAIRLTESDLHRIIKESVNRILKETPLNYDEDNFSGRWTKSEPDYDGYIDSDDCLDNPNYTPNSFDDDEWVDGDKSMENDYSWDRFDDQAVAPGVGGYYKTTKRGVPKEVDDAISLRNRGTQWSDRELGNRDKMMGKWINGERDTDDIDDAWYGVQK